MFDHFFRGKNFTTNPFTFEFRIREVLSANRCFSMSMDV